MAMWRIRIPRWKAKSTDTLTICLLNAFQHQQFLQQGTSMLRYTYFACLVIYSTDTRIVVRF
jgi:hypothetical protein